MKELLFPVYYDIIYPVAEKIDNNYPVFIKMANDFNSLAKEYLGDRLPITFVCVGSSGTIASTIFYSVFSSLYPERPIGICHVKKDGENSHSGCVGNISIDSITVFVDDIISTGSTVRLALEKIRSYNSNKNFKFDYIVVSNLFSNKSVEIAGLTNESETIVYSPYNLR